MGVQHTTEQSDKTDCCTRSLPVPSLTNETSNSCKQHVAARRMHADKLRAVGTRAVSLHTTPPATNPADRATAAHLDAAPVSAIRVQHKTEQLSWPIALIDHPALVPGAEGNRVARAGKQRACRRAGRQAGGCSGYSRSEDSMHTERMHCQPAQLPSSTRNGDRFVHPAICTV
jgi:hypothetical protein